MSLVKRPFSLLWVAALLVAIAACGTGSKTEVSPAVTLEAATQRGPFGVGVITLDLVDTSRSTEPNRDFPGAEERRLITEVWYPAEPSALRPEQRSAKLDRSGAPYPLIIFAHGLSGTRRQSESYVQHLASHGYVVASPDFPLSNMNAPGGPRLRAVLEQPGDVSFLIDSLLGLSAEQGHLLEGVLDQEAIGVTGHSLGGLTALLTAYGPMRDPRVRAVLPISAPGCFLTREVVGDASVPILVLGGSRDLIVDPDSIRQAYDVANPPRYYVELQGADHTRFADVPITDAQVLPFLREMVREEEAAEDAEAIAQAIGGSVQACTESDAGEGELLTPERQRELLRAFATPFFDAYLRGSAEAEQFLEEQLPTLVPEARTEFDPG